MSKMTLSTLINECKKICLDKCIQAIKTINQKKTIQLVIVGYYKEYILANLDLIVNRQKQTVK